VWTVPQAGVTPEGAGLMSYVPTTRTMTGATPAALTQVNEAGPPRRQNLPT
jgi:hypothetical protein